MCDDCDCSPIGPHPVYVRDDDEVLTCERCGSTTWKRRKGLCEECYDYLRDFWADRDR
jgi:ribosomal protein L37E